MTEFINIHTHNTKNTNNNELVNAKLFENLHLYSTCSIGIHPWEINTINISDSLNWLKTNLGKDNVLAMGEIGIDRALLTPIILQTDIFKTQHELAVKYQKPIIIHCVRAWSDLLGIRKDLKTNLTWLFHGYNGNLDTAKQIIESGCYLCFGKALLNSLKLQNVFKLLPLEFVLLETDDGDIEIEEVYEIAAKLRHICTRDLKEILRANFLKVFGK